MIKFIILMDVRWLSKQDINVYQIIFSLKKKTMWMSSNKSLSNLLFFLGLQMTWVFNGWLDWLNIMFNGCDVIHKRKWTNNITLAEAWGLRKYGYGSLPTHKFEKKWRVNLHQVFKLRKSADWLDSKRIADLNFLSQHGLFCNTLVVPRVVVKVVWCFAKQAVNRPLYHKWYNLTLYNHVWTLPFFGIKKKSLKKNVKAPFFYEKRVLKSKVC